MDGNNLDLSQLSDEDAQAVMQMLSPDEQEAFQEMLKEHRAGFQESNQEL